MRICSDCNAKMIDGYVIEGGMDYYCSEQCLYNNIPKEEYLKLYDNGNGDSYWTEWYDEADELNAFDIVVHIPTKFVFRFFDYLDEETCRVMDSEENLYTFPINSLEKGTDKDLEEYKANTAKKFRYLQAYL